MSTRSQSVRFEAHDRAPWARPLRKGAAPAFLLTVSVLLGALVWLRPTAAAAADEQTEPHLAWREEWRRFDWIEYIATGTVVGLWAYVEAGIPLSEEPQWTGGILFDGAVRRAMAGDSTASRNAAGRISDYSALAPAGALFVDTLFLPLIRGSSAELVWQMTAMNVQGLATSGLWTRLGHRYVSRERPDAEACRRDALYDENCFGGTTASMPSGHVSGAFAAAGLNCAHHLYVDLYEDPTLDWTACGMGMGFGVATGFLRVIADRHYFTDVIAGAVLGFGFGFGLPSLLHYDPPGYSGSPDAASLRVTPWVGGGREGFSISGQF